MRHSRAAEAPLKHGEVVLIHVGIAVDVRSRRAGLLDLIDVHGERTRSVNHAEGQVLEHALVVGGVEEAVAGHRLHEAGLRPEGQRLPDTRLTGDQGTEGAAAWCDPSGADPLDGAGGSAVVTDWHIRAGLANPQAHPQRAGIESQAQAHRTAKVDRRIGHVCSLVGGQAEPSRGARIQPGPLRLARPAPVGGGHCTGCSTPIGRGSQVSERRARVARLLECDLGALEVTFEAGDRIRLERAAPRGQQVLDHPTHQGLAGRR